jgi:hypothetical protein
MWELANQTPFAADYGWVMDKEGNRVWLVVTKASFDILRSGRCQLAAENEPVRDAAQCWGEMGQSSLMHEADLLGVKPTTDVLLRGDAISPGGRAAAWLEVSLRVGTIHKRLRVTGDRVWGRGALGPVMSEPAPFHSMPIVYERAYGGWDRSAPEPQDHRLDDRNPVGTGFAVRSQGCEGQRVPNVEYRDQLISTWQDRPVPAGLNAVDCAWSPRRQLAGTYDDAWRKRRFPLWAEDLDTRYFNCAPSDQQTQQPLVGGERVEVTGMSEAGGLAFELPRVRLGFRTRFGRRRVEHEGMLCTVLVEPNAARVSMAWQTWLVCNREADDLDETLIVERRSA